MLTPADRAVAVRKPPSRSSNIAAIDRSTGDTVSATSLRIQDLEHSAWRLAAARCVTVEHAGSSFQNGCREPRDLGSD